ncbi:hypothetical protein D5F01_LYC22374 [Larimichthys crocea]|uniref:Reverse transcriptase RNase H-like domain-containing protein n=1 Tax=Larimichthys crocea TaxID=215358 RepID=A0A6G0HHT7_LARCR|nr:hypothetical protein D5F01_LYC22374 [Larimichthys crocea]
MPAPLSSVSVGVPEKAETGSGYLAAKIGLEGQLARWVEQLANFQYKIVHRPGKLHGNADALSRLPNFGHEVGLGQEVLDSKGVLRVCAMQETPRVPPSESWDVDELGQAQRDDDDLRQIIACKKQGDCRMPEDPKLRKYAPVWDQLCIRDSRLVRIPPAHTDAASQGRVPQSPGGLADPTFSRPYLRDDGAQKSSLVLVGSLIVIPIRASPLE